MNYGVPIRADGEGRIPGQDFARRLPKHRVAKVTVTRDGGLLCQKALVFGQLIPGSVAS